MYIAYCASCHGQDGRGNGPAAPALKTHPTDLTLLAAKNDGKFPDAHIAAIIKGDNLSRPRMATRKCRCELPYSLAWAGMTWRKSRCGYTT
jgi:hypothetical protein